MSLRITELKSDKNGKMTKSYSLGKDGEIVSDGAPLFRKGKSKTKGLKGVEQLEAYLNTLDKTKCIMLGLFPTDIATIVPKFQGYNYDKALFNRTKEHTSIGTDSDFFVMLDLDFKPESKVHFDSAASLWLWLCSAVPELKNINMLIRPSSSAGIHSAGIYKDDHPSWHIYIECHNSCDINLIKYFIQAKTILADLHYIYFSRIGSRLKGNVFDSAVFSPERVVYESEPILESGVEKTKIDSHTYTGGNRLHPDDYKPFIKEHDLLTEADFKLFSNKHYRALINSDEVEERTRQVKEKAIKDLAEEHGIKIFEAAKMLDDLHSKEIGLTNILHFTDLGPVTLADICKTPGKFHCKTLADPVEGTAYGRTTAMFYWNKGKNVIIHSFAHGGTIYRLTEEALEFVASYRKDNPDVIGYDDIADPDNFYNVDYTGRKPTIHLTTSNARVLRKTYGITGAYNVISNELEIYEHKNNQEIDKNGKITKREMDNWEHHMKGILSQNGFKQSTPDLFFSDMMRNRYNPVKDIIDSLEWDGVDRFKEYCACFNMRQPDQLKEAYLKKMLFAAYGALENTMELKHSFKVLPIFQGKQGYCKTPFVEVMFGFKNMDEYLHVKDYAVKTGISVKIDDKDSVKIATSAWVVEFGEFEQNIYMNSVQQFKSYIDRSVDEYRMPYGKSYGKFPRTTLPIGTCNDDAPLKDRTGNSRFWMMNLIQPINLNMLEEIGVLQIHAQMYQEYKSMKNTPSNRPWALTKEEEALQTISNQNNMMEQSFEADLYDIIYPADYEEFDEKGNSTINIELMSASQLLDYMDKKYTVRECRQIGSTLKTIFGYKQGKGRKYALKMKPKKPLLRTVNGTQVDGEAV